MEISSRSLAANTTEVWRKPPTGFVKCNVGFSWSSNTQLAGASWLVRDSDEVALSHSRRAFPGIHSEHQASLVAFGWAAEAMVDLKIDRVFMEVSSGNIQQILSQPSSYPYLSEWPWRLQEVSQGIIDNSLTWQTRVQHGWSLEFGRKL
ncbi:hypothetical protein HID58_033662 [Brassica napus]|uniref:RNase H type-1 domain-containing protein n=1 Tax=Brassica napus TaxID=3708 RepID=A0ABQ8C1S3_BRANA|nr:hypothetical protein HID58_033662 [Brassica napus]